MGDILGLMDESEEQKEQRGVEGKALAVRSESIIEKIKTREIKNDEEKVNMEGFVLEVKSALKGLNDYWDPDIKKARVTTEGLRAKKKADVGPLLNAEIIAKNKLRVYRIVEEDKKRKAEASRRAEQERLQAEAEKKAREEQARKQAEEVAKADAEGRDKVKYIEYEAPAVVEVLPEVVQETPKVSGISYSEHWVWECTDFSKVPETYKKLDEVKINSIVRGLKNDTNIPGIRPYDDKTLRTRI